ncbi:MAG: 2-C-methyl-D-erythritol 2,4-cyclodiphosphate synthase [Clostridia bacterium]|nr:2-C-methyl-D-erythritol 2,4-cyclodiphosphate synthase [Clostridia bacterium]
MVNGMLTPRIGTGWDAHRLVENRALWLGGVLIPYEKGLLGHSDADAPLHALTDALLGAAAMGDIGKLFPDSDPKYKGISSILLLEEVRKRLAEAGFTIGNVDVTIVCQAPKLAPYIPQMRETIAKALEISAEQVSVKATTTERMGYEGRGEGISAQAVAMVFQ